MNLSLDTSIPDNQQLVITWYGWIRAIIRGRDIVGGFRCWWQHNFGDLGPFTGSLSEEAKSLSINLNDLINLVQWFTNRGNCTVKLEPAPGIKWHERLLARLLLFVVSLTPEDRPTYTREDEYEKYRRKRERKKRKK